MKRFFVILLMMAVVFVGCGTVDDYQQEEKTFGSIESEIKTHEPDTESENQSVVENDDENYSDAYQKGKEIGEKLNEEMENIDWEENYEKAEEAGKKAAEWLNGLFE